MRPIRPGPHTFRLDSAATLAAEVAWYTVIGPWCRYDQDALLRPRLAAIRRHYPGSRIMVQPSETDAGTAARCARRDGRPGDRLARPPTRPCAGRRGRDDRGDDRVVPGRPEPGGVPPEGRPRRPRASAVPGPAGGSVGVFGTLEHASTSGALFGGFPNVQGGCYGMTRETARRIRDGGVLGGDGLKADPGAWVDGVADWTGWPGQGVTLEDGLLRWITRRMGLRPFSHDEIDSRFLLRPHGPGGDYAVTHPHKTLESDEGGPRVRGRPGGASAVSGGSMRPSTGRGSGGAPSLAASSRGWAAVATHHFRNGSAGKSGSRRTTASASSRSRRRSGSSGALASIQAVERARASAA